MHARLFAAAVVCAAVVAASCAARSGRAESQIRQRIESIRASIVARQAEGIVRWGTDDWTFTGADGVSFDKAAYLDRTRALMDRIVSVDSLTTTVDAVQVAGSDAMVEITQRMERHERDASTGAVAHVRLKYRERHRWVPAADGWRVRSVVFIGAVERDVLKAP